MTQPTPNAHDRDLVPVPTGQVLNLEQIGRIEIEPGGDCDIVVGLNSTRDFNELERGIAAKVAPLADILRNNPLMAKPLGTQLRPKGTNVELRNGTAQILPFTDELEAALMARQRLRYHPINTTRILVIADTYSSGKGIVGQIAREVYYYWQESDMDGGGVAKRVLGDPKSLIEAEPVIEALRLESIERARRVSAYALQHALRGGLPSLGKRK